MFSNNPAPQAGMPGASGGTNFDRPYSVTQSSGFGNEQVAALAATLRLHVLGVALVEALVVAIPNVT